MSEVASSDDSRIDIRNLLDEFYCEPVGHSQLGEFQSVAKVPDPYESLLDHHAHMTVTVESHYSEKVNVVVHRCHRTQGWYSREITLVTEETGRIVQYGIVRLNTRTLDDEVWNHDEDSVILPAGAATDTGQTSDLLPSVSSTLRVNDSF